MIPIVTSGENVYIQIYSSTGSVLMQVPVTSACQHIQQLSQSDYIKLSWISDTGSLLPAGAYVVGDDDEHYVLLNPYSPTMTDEATYKYEPQFTSRFFSLAKVPFFMYTYDGGGAITLREPDWSLTDNAGNFMQALCDGIYNETGLRYGYAIGSDITVGSATVTFNATDIISAANAIANAFGTEVWLEKTASGSDIGIIHLSKARLNAETAPELIVGTNVGVPSVKDNGAFYNRFYAFGSSRNITQDYMGSGVNNLATKRLTLNPTEFPNGYMDFSGGSNIQSIVLQFDDIYPSATNLVLYDVRPRMRYRLDDNGRKIQIGTDEHGDPVYDSYAIWYAQLKQKDGSTYTDFDFNDSTYDAEDNPDGMMIAGLVPSFHFNSGALTGREFDVIYHKTTQTVQDNADYGSFQIKAGDFEIVYTQEGNLIIPTTVGLIPDDDNLVVLFNVRMPDTYVTSAQARLKEALLKEIREKYLQLDSEGNAILVNGELQPVDRKEYTVKSYSDIFNSTGLSLTVGAAVTFTVGTTSFETRVTSLTKQIDFPDEQSITVGNEVIKGALETLQESAQSANQNINILAAVNQASKSIIDSYNRTQQVLIEGLAAIGNMWLVQPDNSIKLNPDFIGVWAEGFVSAFGQSDTGGGGGGGLITRVYGTSGFGGTYSDTDYTNTFNAYAINTLYDRIVALEGASVNISVNVTGSGNAVTNGSYNNGVITLTKGATFLTSVAFDDLSSHPTTLAGYGITDAKIQNGVITLGGNTITPMTSIGTGSVTNAMLAGSIANGKLANSAITINGSSTALGGSFNTASITAGTAGSSSATSGLSIAIPYVTLNQYGIVTAYGTHTHSISKANITSAIGSTTYAPYNSAGYLPLSGGTMTGDIKMTYGKYLTTADGATIIGVTAQGVFYIGDPQAGWDTNIAGAGDLLHDTGGSLAVILDQENFDTYALPLAGGVMTGPISGVTYLSVNRAAQTTYRLDVNGATRLAGNTSVTGTLGVTGATTLANLTVGSSNSITLGDGVLTWDSNAQAWKLTGNLYATGFISAFGASDTGGSGGGGIDLSAMWANLQVNESGATGYNLQINPGHLTTALGTYVNAITTTGSGNAVTAVSKSGSTLTFTKGSTFALASRTVTGTGYLTGGGALSANRTIDIASTYKGYIDEGHTAYGWGDHAEAGYLTGITSSMVTTALGFTPANSTALANYLPLAGGQMTGPLTWKDSTALPESTAANFFLVIDSFANGGTTKWVSLANVKTSLGLSSYLPLAGGTMTNTNKVTNLNADLLDGLNSTDFAQKFSYILGTASSVDISFTGTYHAIIIARNTNNNEPLILIGGGYGVTSIRNRFKQISTTSSPFHWRYHSGEGVQIINNGLSNASVSVLVTIGTAPTFTAATFDIETDFEDYALETVNGAASKYLPLSGGTLTGDLTAPKFIKTGGTSSQFLKADGSVDSSAYLTTTTAADTYLPLTGGTMTGGLVLSNAIYLAVEDSGGTVRTAFGINSSNNLLIGYDTARQGYTTRIYGGNIVFYYGTSRAKGMTLGSDGKLVMESNIVLPNNISLQAKDTNGTAYAIAYLHSSNELRFGHATAPLGYNTYLYGNNVYLAYGTSRTNGLVLSAAGNVGIGTTTPSYKLDVAGNMRVIATGSEFAKFLVYPTNPYGIVFSSESNGTMKIQSRREASAQYFNLVLNPLGGNVGIGTASPAYKLDVTGVIHSTVGIFSDGYVSAFGQSTTSDARLKKDFLDTTLTVDDIAHAPAITFLWKDREGRRQAGSLAQYWETVLPEVVSDIEGKKGLDYGAAALVSAITIARDVNDHEKRIRELERENRELKRRLGYADR